MSDKIIIAMIAGGVSFLVAIITSFLSIWIYRNQTLTERNAVRIARKIFKYKKGTFRTFDELKRRIGGFEDDELRKILVRAGAIRFYKRLDDVFLHPVIKELSKSSESDPTGEAVEVWGLLSMNRGIVMSYGFFPIEYDVKGMKNQIDL